MLESKFGVSPLRMVELLTNWAAISHDKCDQPKQVDCVDAVDCKCIGMSSWP